MSAGRVGARPGRRLVLAGGLAALASACTGPSPASGRTVLAGGQPDGTFVKAARLLGAQLVERGVTARASVLLTGGSAENLDLLLAGEADLAPVLADTVVGRDLSALTAVARVKQLALHCLVRADSTVTSPADLAGRAVVVGPRLSGAEDSALRLLRVAGLVGTRAPARVTTARSRDAVISVAGGTADAMFWWGGRPAPEITSVARVRPLRALDLRGLLEDANRAADDVYTAVRLPGELYGQADVGTLATPVHLLCRRDLPDATVAGVVDVVSGSGRLLVPQPTDGVQYYVPATLFDTSPVPLHPAAARRYRELHG